MGAYPRGNRPKAHGLCYPVGPATAPLLSEIVGCCGGIDFIGIVLVSKLSSSHEYVRLTGA